MIKIIQRRGRWGTWHFEIEGLNKGDYQKPPNQSFDSREEAEMFYIKNTELVNKIINSNRDTMLHVKQA